MVSSKLSGKVQTVLGPIGPDDLGVTMTHEHLMIDFRCVFLEPQEASKKGLAYAPISMENLGWIRYNWRSNLDNLTLFDEETAITEASRYVRAGGRAMVDATSIGIGRDPVALARIARATGLHVVMGASYYVGSTHPPDMDQRTVEQLADEVVRDITEGVDDTGIRSGIIGEIGCSWPWTDNERKAVRAGGIAQQHTGAPLLIHPGRHEAAPMEIIAELRKTGADISRTIICHIERTIYDWNKLVEVAGAGCYLEYDLFGHESSHYPFAPTDMPSDAQRMDQIAWLIGQGFVENILLAHDVCTKHRLARYGGHGFDHILNNIVPRLRQRGVTEEQVHTMLVENPKRVLTFK
ncbi:MAG: phosphotriesterase-related protein [Chloroflexi bacterium]|nr:phosphotriesterase-related protein [Chloroflexota bacterium]